MGWGSQLWVVGLLTTAVLAACLAGALRQWNRLIQRYIGLDESTPELTVAEVKARMERARYLTLSLALLVLAPLNPAIFALILKHPRLHVVLSIGAIALIVRNSWGVIAKLDARTLFPTKPTALAIVRNAGIGLCLGFVLSLCWQLAVDNELRQLVVNAWKSK